MNSASQPFGIALRDLLMAHGVTTRIGNPDWAGFAQRLPGIHYETLRKAVTGERYPAAKIIEAVSDVLGVEPATFAEYRLWVVQRQFDPNTVGLERALKNVRRLDRCNCA
jgi:hypothetical protein